MKVFLEITKVTKKDIYEKEIKEYEITKKILKEKGSSYGISTDIEQLTKNDFEI